MYHETVRYPATKWGSALLLGGIVLVTILLSWLCGLFHSAGLPYLDMLAFLALLAMLFFVMRQRIFQYKYSVVDNELILSRLCGRKEKHLLSLDMEQIESYAPCAKASAADQPRKKRLVHAMIPTKKLQMKRILLTEDGVTTCVFLQPSERLDAILQEYVKASKQQRV